MIGRSLVQDLPLEAHAPAALYGADRYLAPDIVLRERYWPNLTISNKPSELNLRQITSIQQPRTRMAQTADPSIRRRFSNYLFLPSALTTPMAQFGSN